VTSALKNADHHIELPAAGLSCRLRLDDLVGVTHTMTADIARLGGWLDRGLSTFETKTC
jgi:hypothetical protein